MKVELRENQTVRETEVLITCHHVDGEVKEILAYLKKNRQLTATKDGQVVLLSPLDICYFESVDKKTFVYLDDDVLETSLRLYQLEDLLSTSSFIRANKACLLNLLQVLSLKPVFGARMEATLKNGERIIISRQYLPGLKNKIGIGGKQNEKSI
ncbi:MAG: LytTR family transcriptional regulator DNA-binding domain-containing protein [Erysipelotrichaceae bacterium]|jgi:DNA-binding LytR/AlgR family response regulator|nr:LytTR family transcriptional regulator DNA-binding domain-containing protein [Erysipelotrichaceae bacterium]